MTGPQTKDRVRLETKTERRPAGGELVVDHAPRCWNCHRPLFETAARPWVKQCDACRARNASPQD